VGQLAPTEDNLTMAHEALLAALNENPDAFAGYLA
jgi:hypothetical protein